MPYIKTGDQRQNEAVNLFYEDYGQGQPVVFVHGWPLDHQMWEYQLTDLPGRGLRCIAYDRRGFGKSSKPYDGYNYDTFADDLKAVLDQLDLQNVTLVGFSMGAGEIARYMSRHGGARVAKVVLASGVTPYLLKTDDNPDGVDRSTFDDMVDKIRTDRADFLQTFGKQFYGVGMLSKPVSQAMLDGDFMRAYLASPKATIDCVRAFSETDFRSDVQTINVPALIIHGDADKTVPIESSGEQTANLMMNASYKIYEGAPHGLFYTEREQFNRDLLEFILEPSSVSNRTSTVTY
ncbi:alpha/beta fold hydrolase [Rudanella paleaurantiibacter]|uniref:Alpha/beta fold hydrolase n=1 Tax=Rudanella paleaurantiibacter TaxID=2614655 RepID=A0A7J5U5W9_9BACT|nr:alpha/beta hydrolase [Rudanella paleaurantiibacter]KAB7733248.1 alpha/beta fold hydrolase [Rudanella paleaurantiibacter]